MGSKDSASPHASFILTRKYFFIVSFTSIYILLSRYSNNRNLNLRLFNKYLLGGLVFKIFKIVKIVFLRCFYVTDNRVFPAGGVFQQPKISPRQASSSSNFYSRPPKVYLPHALVPFLFYVHKNLVLINVLHIKFCFYLSKGSNGQNSSSSDSHHPITPTPSKVLHPLTLKAFWKTLDNRCISYGLLNL